MDIGGWCSAAAVTARSEFGDRLLGVVEDTEAGHRVYEKLNLDFPVVSVARSPLKDAEDNLAGHSVIFSVERLTRRLGRPLSGCRVLVLGFGKVGQGVARAALGRGASVDVFDVRSDRRALALTLGYRIPDRAIALREADIIVGCTGNGSLHASDLANLRDGAIVASGSSKRLEFTFPVPIERNSGLPDRIATLTTPSGGRALLVADGEPVNFLDDAVIGPALRLVQGGLLAAAVSVISQRAPKGISDLAPEFLETVSDTWIKHYVRPDGLLK